MSVTIVAGFIVYDTPFLDWKAFNHFKTFSTSDTRAATVGKCVGHAPSSLLNSSD